ncbi:hypothetical protein [Pseudomonas sp. MUP55]|uniref:hypothetical protein n=1 Tax=Pseudomonas sp. MUP55 TaxID=3087234 RepID=UPI002A5A4158|nr:MULTISPECIES: hypothetical protein [unclassified Pseudomonas]WPN93111.1 hypothetical protein SC319_01675 [Pseudomonas sp. MUP56]WPN98637.1 hypothetical protein SC318_01675 [Pseudomonas sp. MUP55]
MKTLMGFFRDTAKKVHSSIDAVSIMGDVFAEQRQDFFTKAHSLLLTTQLKDVKLGKRGYSPQVFL